MKFKEYLKNRAEIVKLAKETAGHDSVDTEKTALFGSSVNKVLKPIYEAAVKSLPNLTGVARANAINEATKIKNLMKPSMFGKAMGALPYVAIGGGVIATESAVKKYQQASQLNKVKDMVIENLDMPKEEIPRANEMFDVLSTYAPTVARNPVFAREFVKNMTRYDAVDHKIVGDLIKAERTMLQVGEHEGEASRKAKKMMDMAFMGGA